GSSEGRSACQLGRGACIGAEALWGARRHEAPRRGSQGTRPGLSGAEPLGGDQAHQARREGYLREGQRRGDDAGRRTAREAWREQEARARKEVDRRQEAGSPCEGQAAGSKGGLIGPLSPPHANSAHAASAITNAFAVIARWMHRYTTPSGRTRRWATS